MRFEWRPATCAEEAPRAPRLSVSHREHFGPDRLIDAAAPRTIANRDTSAKTDVG